MEYKAKKALEDFGFEVLRSAGSKGCFDLIAVNGQCVRLVQCKAYIDNPSSYKKDLERIAEYACPDVCSKELWIYKSGSGWVSFLISKESIVPIEFPRSKSGVIRFLQED